MKLDSRARKIFRKFPRDVKEYFEKLDQKCQKHGILLKLGGGKEVNFGHGRCGGYFDDSGKEMNIAIGGSIQSLMANSLHEEGHLDQFLGKSKIWHQFSFYNGHTRFFKYLSGERIYKVNQAVQAAIAIEKECEKIAIKKIKKKWQKYIDLDWYIASASAYLFSYLYMAKKRKWPKNTPCIAQIRAHCPNKILRSYKTIPERLEAAFDRYL